MASNPTTNLNPGGGAKDVQVATPATCRTSPQLNFDVLLVILSMVEARSDVGCLMQTCKTLHKAGIPLLLDDQVVIRTVESFLSLYSFLHCGDLSRYRYLRDFNLHIDYLPPHIGGYATDEILLSLFQNAKFLQTLYLNSWDELPWDKRIRDAIADLTSIRDFRVSPLDKAAWQMLKKFRSPLTKFKIDFGGTYYIHEPACRTLEHFKDSIQDLSVRNLELTFDHLVFVYPNLTRLFASGCSYFATGDLVRAFPNLLSLTLCVDREEYHFGRDEGFRQGNIAAQRGSLGTWERLDYLNGSLRVAYDLAAQCQIMHWDVDSTHLKTTDGARLHSVLSDTTPATLSLAIKAIEFDCSQLGEFIAPAKDTLAAVRITLYLSGKVYKDPSATIVTLLKSLSSYRIQLFYIILSWTPDEYEPLVDILPITDSYANRSPTPSSSLPQLDTEPLAQAAIRFIPSLKHFFLDIDSGGDVQWEVKDGPKEGDAKRMVRLTSYDEPRWQVLRRQYKR